MNRDDIMRLVVEAGGVEGEELDRHLQPIEGSTYVEFSENQLKAFVVLIEAAEREACAKLADSLGYVDVDAIRARGET
jgi:hypothetical protein